LSYPNLKRRTNERAGSSFASPPLETGPSRLGARRTRFAQEGKIFIFFAFNIFILKTPKAGCPKTFGLLRWGEEWREKRERRINNV